MGNYGEASIKAVELYITGQVKSPEEAWERATTEKCGKGTSSQKKTCPKEAFLGLCEEGLIKGIPRGDYTNSEDNKRYALDAVAVLKQNPALAKSQIGLWRKVMRGEPKTHNQQMDVVISLWNSGLLFARPQK
jgi:hypothetical protein